MPIGKPNFNLNSFGVKYLSKDEIQEFLEKRTQGESIRSQGETKTRPLGTSGKPMDSSARQDGQHRGSTAGLKQGEFTPSLAGSKQIDATINTPNVTVKPTPTSDTKTYFTTAENPNKKENSYQKQVNANNTGNNSGFVNTKVKPLHGKNIKGNDTSKPDEGTVPKVQQGKLGTSNETLNTPTGSRETMSTNISSKKDEKDDKEKKTNKVINQKGAKNLPSQVGNAPPDDSNIEEKVSSDYSNEGISKKPTRSGSGGKKVEVGVGVKAHEEFKKREGVGVYKKPKTNPTESTGEGGGRKKQSLNGQHKRSPSVVSHNKRSKDNAKWYSSSQRSEYKKIPQVKNDKGEMVDDRDAQSKFHSEQEKKYGKSVSTPKKLSAAGQAIKDKLKKSNNIILKMNILKLDLMKGKKDPLGERLGSVIGKPKNITNDGVADYEKGDDNDFFSLDDKALKSQAEETIFKAISLKLDLMKTDYSSPTDIDMKDVYEKKRVKEVEAKHNTSCPHCKQTLPKYKPEPIDDY